MGEKVEVTSLPGLKPDTRYGAELKYANLKWICPLSILFKKIIAMAKMQQINIEYAT